MLNKKILLFSFLIVSIVQAGPKIMGAYPSWSKDVSPSQINYKLFTHIGHAFILADKDGYLKPQTNIPNADLVQRAHAAGVKVILLLGGADSGQQFFSAMAANPEAVKRFVGSVTDLLVKYHYDGVDIDWEFPNNAEDSKNLSKLIALFRKELDRRSPGALLSIDLSPGPWFGQWTDVDAIAPLVDFANDMTYDFHGPWSVNGHNANLYPVAEERNGGSAAESVSYWTQTRKWPVEKLCMGIPCYGHGFVGKLHEKPQGTSKYAGIDYKDSIPLIKEGWTRQWDKEGAVPYLTSKDGKEFISYDDKASVALKAEWAKKNHLAGIFFWEITGDFIDNKNVLIQSARKAFLDK